jgi:hypothetical protein
MGRPRKTPLNGDSKLIYDAISDVKQVQSECLKCLATIQADVAAETATRVEQHASNLRSLESMSGDVHIVLNRVQSLPCGAEKKRIDANEKNIVWLRNFTIGGVLLFIVGAAVKIWLL